MQTILLSVSDEWITENRSKYGNILRKIWKKINSECANSSLSKMDVRQIEFNISEGDESRLVDILGAFVASDFSSTCDDMGITIKNITKPGTSNTNEEKASSPATPATASAAPKKAEPEVSDSASADTNASESSDVPAASSDSSSTSKKSAHTPTRAAKKAASESSSDREITSTESSSESVAKSSTKSATESTAESTPNDRKINSEDYCKDIPVKYSKVLQNYIEELSIVTNSLRDLSVENVIWSECLLVSINSGYGFGQFVNTINKMLMYLYPTETSARSKGYSAKDKEEIAPVDIIEVVSLTDKNKEFDVSACIDTISRKANSAKWKVVALDISQCMYDLKGPTAKQRLREIARACKDAMVIYKVPVIEGYKLEEVREDIDDIMSTRSLLVPPTSLDDMYDYVKLSLEELKFTEIESVRDYIEKLIISERKHGYFFGFDTLDNIVNKIQYEKAYYNGTNDKTDHNLTPDVFKRLIIEDINSNEDPYESLEKLIGIDDIKTRIREIVAQIKGQQQLKEQGVDIEPPCIHMSFTGAPGTGKTTVARLLGRILKKEGVLRYGHFFEVKGRDLCGRYVGETTPKTQSICRDAYGSVLFIDEAYSLASHSDSNVDYGQEAVTALIAEMENHRNDMCVIFAGYENDMKDLFKMNPGFTSRVPFTLKFPNYSRDELCQIFFSLVDGKFSYEPELKDALVEYLDSIPDEMLNDDSFGNGRFMRNLYERVWGKAILRCNLDKSDEFILKKQDLTAVTSADIFDEIKNKKPSRQRIGF